MTGAEIIAAIGAVVALAQQVPSLVQSFEQLIALVKAHGELSDAQKVDLLAQLASTAARVAAYKPRDVA